MNLTHLLEKSLDSKQLDLIRHIADESSVLGFPIFLVGGFVRDLLLNRPVKDLDLTLEGDAIVLGRALVKKYAGKLTTHDHFGTATWTFESAVSDLEFLDLISARKETYAHPGALPTVTRSTIDDDLRRRDFSINAMAIRLDGGHFGDLFDPLGGQKDLEDKLIRVLHDKSFVDDPTRMFRAVRYSMRYGFDLEPETQRALSDGEAREVLSMLSGERVRHEFDLIFEEKQPLLALAALDDLGLLKIIHPAFEKTHAKSSSYLNESREGPGKFALPDTLSFNQTLGWILLLIVLTKDEIESIAERLAFPALLKNAAQSASILLNELPSLKAWNPSQWTFHLDGLPSLAVYAVWLVASEPALNEYLTKWQDVRQFTTGDDLKARGLEPGPRFGEILRRLRAAWLDGEVANEKDEERLLTKLLHP